MPTGNVPEQVAATLNTELGTTFLGRPPNAIDIQVTVDRSQQLHAVRAHPSQAVPGSALWRRLDLLADTDHLAWLRYDRGPDGSTPPDPTIREFLRRQP